MKKIFINKLALIALIFLFHCSCNNQKIPDEVNKSKTDTTKEAQVRIKPPSFYQDTLKIRVPATVFFYPDSTQLEKIKALTKPLAYSAIIHENFYEVRYAHNVIKKSFPGLKIIEAKNCRYLLFIKKDGSAECRDLDKYADKYGLLVFNGKKSPQLIDMVNLDMQIPIYLRD